MPIWLSTIVIVISIWNLITGIRFLIKQKRTVLIACWLLEERERWWIDNQMILMLENIKLRDRLSG